MRSHSKELCVPPQQAKKSFRLKSSKQTVYSPLQIQENEKKKERKKNGKKKKINFANNLRESAEVSFSSQDASEKTAQ